MRRLIPLFAAVAALTIAAIVTVVAVGASSGGSDKNANRQSEDSSSGSGVAAMCVEGVPDCNDMIVEPNGGSMNMCVADAAGEDCDDMIGEGTSRCSETASPECEAVDSPPPIRSDEGIDPNECSLVHNIDACSPEDIARIEGSATTYGVTVPFDASVTEEDLKVANEIILAFDVKADFLVQESFPPTGRATLTSSDPDVCAAIEPKLESIPAVGDVTCSVAEDAPPVSNPDEPVSSEPAQE